MSERSKRRRSPPQLQFQEDQERFHGNDGQTKRGVHPNGRGPSERRHPAPQRSSRPYRSIGSQTHRHRKSLPESNGAVTSRQLLLGDPAAGAPTGSPSDCSHMRPTITESTSTPTGEGGTPEDQREQSRCAPVTQFTESDADRQRRKRF